MEAERASKVTSKSAAWLVHCRQGIDRLRRLKSLALITLWLAVLAEMMLWVGGAGIAYWQVPESVAAIRSHGIEAPRSMVRALHLADWIYDTWRSTVPLIVAGIFVPKLILFFLNDRRLWIASILVGWAVPLVFLYYLIGTPLMLKLGIWP